jgi:hypothetical protein
MDSLLNLALFSSSIFILAIVFALLCFTHRTRLFKYLAEHYPITSDEIKPENSLDVSQHLMEPRSIFKELNFLFSSDNIDDKVVTNHKKYSRIFLILTVLTLLLWFFGSIIM